MLRSALIGLAAALWATTALAQASNATRELTATFARPGGEELRFALVIGNSAYTDAPLKNPANDARLMSETLNDVGFAVTEVVDADWRAMKRAIQEFGRDLDQAGDNAVGLFYYAGHGIQFGGNNYLIPVGAPIASEADVEIEAVNAASVLAQMEYARNRLNIVILDACRNNPYQRSFRSAPNGLAQMVAPSGSLLAFSTAPGAVAADGTGDYSPYAQALAALMKDPGLEVYDLFREVVVRVRETAPRQVPWFQAALDGEFYFARATAEEAPVAPAPVPAPAPPGPVYDREADIALWDRIADSDDPRLFEAYLKQFPKGLFVDFARIRIEDLTQQAAAPPVVEEEPVSVAPPAAAAVPADLVPPDSMLADDEIRRTVQQALNGLGYNAGTVDGVFGLSTRKAIRFWQEDAGEEPTGRLTARQQAALIGAWRDAGSPAAPRVFGADAFGAQPGASETSGTVETARATAEPAFEIEGQVVYELGLELAALTPEIRADLGLDATTDGLLITDVRASGRSANKNLAAGDVIERVNRRPMTKPVEVINEVTVRLREGQTTFRLDVRKPDGALWTVLVPIN